MAPQPPPAPRGGMSLYANLLEPKSDSASISGAPVLYSPADGDKDEAPKKDANSALRFQPIRRPQLNQKKPKPTFHKAIAPSNQSNVPSAASDPAAGNGAITTSSSTAASAAPASAATASSSGPAPGPAQQPRSTLADWAATEEDEYMWGTGEKRQRGGRRKKKKKQEEVRLETDWDELYDPARPTNVEEYLRSDERIREIQEWKAVLYAHWRRRKPSYDHSDEDSEAEGRLAAMNNQFAPPPDLSFAPPPPSPPTEAPPQNAAAAPPAEETADEAYARRLALSGAAPPPPAPEATPSPPPPPPPPPGDQGQDNATISRAPVRYEAPPPPADDSNMNVDDEGDDYKPTLVGSTADDNTGDTPMANDESSDAPAPRSNRPGQAGFAQRLMSKYGWTQGSGLGADSSGILNPLRVQVEKRRKRPDAEGGGYAEPGGRGRIIGSKRGAPASQSREGGGGGDDDEGPGAMSNVVVLRNMLEGMANLEAEIADGLGQEIGEECGDKYGRVERLHIDVAGRQVFIKFTDAVSALRAVNALRGRIFNGNAIAARFYDAEAFEKGDYSSGRG